MQFRKTEINFNKYNFTADLTFLVLFKIFFRGADNLLIKNSITQ